MAHDVIPHFVNDLGVGTIRVGAREVMCMGARPPFDHPHVFLEIEQSGEKLCPYCGVLYRHDPALGPSEADPAACLLADEPV